MKAITPRLAIALTFASLACGGPPQVALTGSLVVAMPRTLPHSMGRQVWAAANRERSMC